MYKLYSERIRNRDGEPEVYIYDEFPQEFRNQVFVMLENVIDYEYEIEDGEDYAGSFWQYVYDHFFVEKGEKINRRINSKSKKDYIREYIEISKNEDFLDLVDFVFSLFYCWLYGQHNYENVVEDMLYDIVNDNIKELNYRFKQHNLGYEFVNGEIIRVDNKILHQEVVKPALRLLYEEGFDGAEEEFRRAFEYRRKGDNKNAILEAGKSFESTLKTICDKKGYAYDKAKDTAKTLITILETNNFYPSYMSSHMANLRITLETGLPVVRNKNSGHGQGSTVTQISDEFTEYALNLAATNIVLLVGIYKKNQ